MLSEFGWRDVAALVTSITVMSGIVIAWAKYRLAGDFASKADMGEVSRRLDGLEAQMRLAPTHSDFALLSGRVAAVERGVDVGNAELRGLREGQARIERDLSMLVQHHIKTGT